MLPFFKITDPDILGEMNLEHGCICVIKWPINGKIVKITLIFVEGIELFTDVLDKTGYTSQGRGAEKSNRILHKLRS